MVLSDDVSDDDETESDGDYVEPTDCDLKSAEDSTWDDLLLQRSGRYRQLL